MAINVKVKCILEKSDDITGLDDKVETALDLVKSPGSFNIVENFVRFLMNIGIDSHTIQSYIRIPINFGEEPQDPDESEYEGEAIDPDTVEDFLEQLISSRELLEDVYRVYLDQMMES